MATLPDRYTDARLVGRGGMGDIYLARDSVLGRRVAVKILHERFAADADLHARFRREALTAARLSGEQNVVTIFDVGEHGGRPFIVMEYLTGGTLAERAGGAPVEPGRALAWLREAARALDAAHAHGVVHRDVKPANLIFDGDDRLHVVDFGIARLADGSLGLTSPGTVLGTAGYLAPEQAQGRETTAASDRYALAIVAYELLTGGRPFERSSETAEAAAHIRDPVPLASERARALPAAVDGVFARALAKDPGSRYRTATDFVEALAGALRAAPVTAVSPETAPSQPKPWTGAVVAGALLLLGGGVAAALVARDDGSEPTGSPRPETVTERVTVERDPTTAPETVTEAAPASARVGVQEAAALNDEAYGLMQEGRWEEALELLRPATHALKGTYSDGFRYEAYAEYNLGRTLVELDRCGPARRPLERSARLQGERSEITEALARCEPDGGKPEKPKKGENREGDD